MVPLQRGAVSHPWPCDPATASALKAPPTVARSRLWITSKSFPTRIDMLPSLHNTSSRAAAVRGRCLRCLSLAVAALGVLSAQQMVYKDVKAPFEKRADDLLSRMTLEEKISQLMNDSPGIDRLGVP